MNRHRVVSILFLLLLCLMNRAYSQTTGTTTGLANTRLCHQFGARSDNAGVKIAACLAALPSAGGTADARGFEGAQTISSPISIGAGKTLLLGAATYTCTAASICITLSGANAQLIGFSRDVSVVTQKSTAAPYSTISITASNTTVRGLSISGLVAPTTEAAEELACILVAGPLTAVRDTVIEDNRLSGKVGGIFTSNSDATGAFKIANLVMRRNVIRTLHYGIFVGGYLQSTILNDGIYVTGNDISVASGSYTGFYNARPLQIWNANNVLVEGNRSLGGFSCIELISSPATSLAHRAGNAVKGNICDSHMSVTQMNGGIVSGNTIDMSLRDSRWPAYDSAGIRAVYPGAAGMEAADNSYTSVTGNTVRGSVGAGIDFGANISGTLSGNTIEKAGNTARPPSQASCIAIPYGNNTDSVISDNTMTGCARSGIWQWDTQPGWVITRMVISNNKIRGTQEHGIKIRNVNGISITGNTISTVSQAAGAFNGIDFTPVETGDSVRGQVDVSHNTIDGGAYCIYQPYVDAVANRSTFITYNNCANPTVQAFKFWGHRKGNSNGTAGERRAVTKVTAENHLDLSDGLDYYDIDNTGGGITSIEFFDNVTLNDHFILNFSTGTTTLIHHTGRLALAGSANVIPTAGSQMEFVVRQDGNNAATISEVSRTIR